MGSYFLPYFSRSNLIIQNIDIELKFDGDNAYQYLEDQINIGFRIPGTQERINCTNYFISKFKDIDIKFTYILHNFTVHSVECQNVLFKLNENNSNIIILGAHYDSRAKATKDSDSLKRNDPVPGANDGASGSAVLIELAKAFYQVKENLSCQIWFLFFDAEDQGIDEGGAGILGWDWVEGSRKFVNEIDSFHDSQNEEFDAMILLDMVGGTNLKFIDEQYSTSSLLDELFAVGRSLGYTSQFPLNPMSASIIDDHRAFLNHGIPSADLIINFWDNPNWPFHHTTQDNLSNIGNISLDVTGKTVEQFVYNNYFNSTIEEYEGNFPWSDDINRVSIEILMYFLIIGSSVAIIIFIVNIVKQKPAQNID
ncbi:MAG: M28 family peptidase [Candidatus Thorarchaeota archaeon]